MAVKARGAQKVEHRRLEKAKVTAAREMAEVTPEVAMLAKIIQTPRDELPPQQPLPSHRADGAVTLPPTQPTLPNIPGYVA